MRKPNTLQNVSHHFPMLCSVTVFLALWFHQLDKPVLKLTGEEYKKYWQLGGSYYKGYEKYKKRASHRYIPIMVLEPKESR